MEEKSVRRGFLLSKGWLQAVIIVMLLGFTVLGILAVRTYQDGAPVPVKVVDPSGQLIFDGDDVSAGQQVFLHNGLMEYGSVFGHGAYLGPDYTADYLRRSSNIAIAENLVVTERAVEKHVTSIFSKLDLAPTGQDHRRVLAVLTYVKAIGD